MPLLRPRVVRSDKPGPGRIMVAAPGDQDSLLKAVINWIPVEVLTVYKFIIGWIPSNYESFRLWTSVAAIPISALWIAFSTRPEGRNIAWRQVTLAPVAFTCWAAAMQGDILKGIFPSWEPWMGSVVLGAGTLLLPILDGILRALGVLQN